MSEDAYAGGYGTGSDWQEALDGALAAAGRVERPDITFLFAHSAYAPVYQRIVEAAQKRLSPVHLVGCSGQGLIASRRELENAPAIVAMSVRLPGAALTSVRFRQDDAALPSGLPSSPAGWLLFTDPYSIDASALLYRLQNAYPRVPIVGGIASSLIPGGGTAVFLDGEVYDEGAVGIAVAGIGMRMIVSQGCMPIGQPWTITDATGNLVETIASRPALQVLLQTLRDLDPETRRRAESNLLVGLAMNEYRDEHGVGDFLIRNLIGVQHETGALAISGYARAGQTLQFQLRDARTADEHLRRSLQAANDALGGERPAAALLCSCNGRGSYLFGPVDHDPVALADVLGEIPVAGLFCNGEIGPVGDQNFLHGFTATIALFTSPPSPTPSRSA
jgi:small ligand-binding sensory domain FIST